MRSSLLFCFFFVFLLSSCNDSVLLSRGEESLKLHTGGSVPFTEASVPLDNSNENIKQAVWQVRNDLVIRTTKFHEEGSGRHKTIKPKKVTERKPLSYGSGFSINPELIVTNFHVITNIDGNTEITVNRDKSMSSNFFSRARLLRVSSIYDLALLQIDGEKKMDKWLSVRSSVSEPRGKNFFLLGYPDTRFVKLKLDFHEYADPVDPVVARFTRGDSAGQLSGASGGPIIDEGGLVAGVFHASSTPSDTQPAYASAIWTNALNDFLLNRNGRDCLKEISEEECVNKEWMHLERNAQTGSYRLAEYGHGLFGEYDQWRRKRDAFKNFTRDLAEYNSALDDALTALEEYDTSGTDINFRKYESAIEDLESAKDDLNHSLSVLRDLQES